MNSLIALGTTTSFAAGSLSALVPGVNVDPSFLEEPVMLLAFVLLGRSLEARARVRASGEAYALGSWAVNAQPLLRSSELHLTSCIACAADLSALAQLIPTQARLVLDAGVKPGSDASSSQEVVMVPTSTIRAGDLLSVLPGERMPVDGTVVQGRCCVDESMLTGESR